MITRNILKNVEKKANLEANLDSRISNIVWKETVWDHPAHNPIPNMFLFYTSSQQSQASQLQARRTKCYNGHIH